MCGWYMTEILFKKFLMKIAGNIISFIGIAAYVMSILLFMVWVAVAARDYAREIAHYCPNSYSNFNASHGE